MTCSHVWVAGSQITGLQQACRAALLHYRACNAHVVPLVTAAAWAAGQERKEVPGSQHLACTVEMVPLARRVDVAIIDEIQACRSKKPVKGQLRLGRWPRRILRKVECLLPAMKSKGARCRGPCTQVP